MVSGTVAEECAGYAFSYVCVLVVLVNAELLVIHIDLHPFHQAGQLLLDISCPPQRTDLNEIISAPLVAVLELLPSVKNVQKSEVISSRSVECFFGIVGMHFLIFWPEEDAIAH